MIYLNNDKNCSQIHLETRKVYAEFLKLEKDNRVHDWTWQHQREYYMHFYNTKNSSIREDIKLLEILEETERKIAWCQYEAKLTPITRDGTFRDLQALYPEEVEEYEWGPTMCNANTTLNQFERFLDNHK
ncbi:uncharacterized protein LOC122859567 [Aphidius gifuensis]|uniref:uncharacterized protein LOC122859567 n=1 Tax=Aphidius gifuensis TaxID=684658 RepID=UPI001CDC6249|nr:uncharacterized protein LOC122859567 [Aphidius gifuensis]